MCESSLKTAEIHAGHRTRRAEHNEFEKFPLSVFLNPTKNKGFHTCLPPYPIVVCVSTENKNAEVQESTLSTQTTPLSY